MGAVHMIPSSLAVPNGLVSLLRTMDQAGINTQKSSMSLGWVIQGLCPSTMNKVHHE